MVAQDAVDVRRTPPFDAAGPWTIKLVSNATREAIIRAARREGLTVGQWLERRVSEWEADGSPVAIGSGGAPLDLAGLAQLLGALGTLPEGGLRRDAERTTRAVLRQARRAIAEQFAGLPLVRVARRHDALPPASNQEVRRT